MEIPIPIQNKITFEKWSRQKMKYSEHDNIYILTILSNYLKEWIDKNTDLNRIIDDDNFYEQFKRFIYKEYVRPLENYNYNIVDHEYYEHFNLKYSEEIVDIFMYYQKYTKSLNSDLFHLKNDTSYPFLEFIFSICEYKDPYNDESDMTGEKEDEIDELYEYEK